MKKPLKIIGLIIFALIFYFSGYLIGHRNIVVEENLQPKLVNKELYKPREIDFSLFWDVWNKINQGFAGKIDTQKIVYGAISGMVEALDDPYSIFMEPDATKSFIEDLSGAIEGIGAEISMREGQIVVVSPLKDSPAEKAGIKPSDKIIKIDNISTEDMSLEEAIGKIRGKAGTKVVLEIKRSDSKETQTITVMRQRIVIKSVEWRHLNGETSYLKISQFGDDTADLVQEALEEIKSAAKKSLIIDLRNNPGGYLDQSVDVASFLMKSGVVVKEQFKDGRINEERTTQNQILDQVKIIVLINGGSASASEIVAGALQDTGLAILVGEKTFGKGSVQSLEELSNGSSLRLTTAKWLTPNGRMINGSGIEPDIKISLSEDDLKNNRDPQLDKALELVK